MEDPTATPPAGDEAAAPDTASTASEATPAESVATKEAPVVDPAPPADAQAGVTPGAGPGTVAGPIPGVFSPATEGAVAGQQADAPATGAGGNGSDGGVPGDGGDPPKKVREAVVYVPGLMHDAKFDSIEAVAHRIARAMDNNDKDRTASYSAATGENATYDGLTARTAVIRRKVGQEETEVVDVYEFDYRPLLLNGFEKRLPLVQAWQIFATLLSNAGNFAASVVRKGQSLPQKLQVGLAGLLGISMFLYIILLVATVVGTARQVTKEVANDPVAVAQAQQDSVKLENAKADPWSTMRTETQGWRGRVDEAASPPAVGWVLSTLATVLTFAWWLITWPVINLWALALHVWHARTDVLIWMQTAVVSFSFGGMVFRWNLKQKLEQVSTETTCASGYLAYGTGRNQIVGRLSRLLDHVGSRPDVTYRNVHLVGYSFGSVVALDSIYQDSEVNETFRQVTTLSTIGCPADFIRTYWIDYFVGRQQLPGTDAYWVNVFAPADVLSSNFVEGGAGGTGAGKGEATRHNGIPGAGVLMHSRERKRGAGLLSRAWTGAVNAVMQRAEEMKEERKPQVDGKDRLPDAHVQFGPPAPQGMVAWVFYIVAGDGFKAHTCYWDRDPVGSAKTCWEPVMKRLYDYPGSVNGPADAEEPAAVGAGASEAGGAA